MLAALSALALAGAALASPYLIGDTYIGADFFSGFTWEAIADPTHGRVNYVDQDTAVADGLSYVTGTGTFVMRADDTTTLTPAGPGRNSIRIQSNNAYTYALMVLDLSHMPEGCSTWPSWWTTDVPNWPNGGEIDIIEGVNNEIPNLSSLHTTAGCTMPGSGRTMLGNPVSYDCNANDNGNQGCGVDSYYGNSFGPPFNANGGGIYAMERTTTSISVWFWPSGTAPTAVANGAATLDTTTFGEPDALFVNTDCDIPSHFDAHNIIFDLTLCGDWAGNAYPGSCPGDCIDYVNNNPSAFTNAYWDINALRVYNPVVGPSARARSLQATVPSCGKSGELVCGTVNGHRQWECVHVLSELESCGGCTYPPPFPELASTTPLGTDCSAIPHVADVRCSFGTCVVEQCEDGFVPSSDHTTCVASERISYNKGHGHGHHFVSNILG